MRIAVLSKDRLTLEALSGLLHKRGSWLVVVNETNVRELVVKSKDSSAQILVIDGEKLDSDELQFLLGARAGGEFLLIVIGEPLADSNVDAFVSRSSSASDLYACISDLSSSIAKGAPLDHGKRPYGTGANLTEREYEVAALVAKGMSNRTIAEAADLHEQSVKNLVSVIMRKLKCENRTQVALKLLHADVD